MAYLFRDDKSKANIDGLVRRVEKKARVASSDQRTLTLKLTPSDVGVDSFFSNDNNKLLVIPIAFGCHVNSLFIHMNDCTFTITSMSADLITVQGVFNSDQSTSSNFIISTVLYIDESVI